MGPPRHACWQTGATVIKVEVPGIGMLEEGRQWVRSVGSVATSNH